MKNILLITALLSTFYFPNKLYAYEQLCRVSIVSANIFPTQSSGKCWDIGCLFTRGQLDALSQALAKVFGLAAWKATLASSSVKVIAGSTYLPDAFVALYIDGKEVLRTSSYNNSLTPIWRKSTIASCSKKSSMRVFVYDKDYKTHDAIGATAISRIPLKFIKSGGIMSLRFGRVFDLKVLFQPVQDKYPQVFSKARDNVYYWQPKKSFEKDIRKVDGYSWLSYIPFQSSYKKARKKIDKTINNLNNIRFRMELKKNKTAQFSYKENIRNKVSPKVGSGYWRQTENYIYVYENLGINRTVTAFRCQITPKFLKCKSPNKKFFFYFSSWR